MNFQSAFIKIDSVNYTANTQKAIVNLQLDNSNDEFTVFNVSVKMTEKKDAEKVKVTSFERR
jgi:hypothetical protein